MTGKTKSKKRHYGRKLTGDDGRKHAAWMLIGYPESLVPDWEQQLKAMHIKVAYVLHDKDVTAENKPKKPHYHIIVMYSGPTTYAMAMEIATEINAHTPIEHVKNLRIALRYLTHKDDYDKHQYPDSDVHLIGMPQDEYANQVMSQGDKQEIINDMLAFINKHHIYYYAEFRNFCMAYRKDWAYSIDVNRQGNSISQYLQSLNAQIKALQARNDKLTIDEAWDEINEEQDYKFAQIAASEGLIKEDTDSDNIDPQTGEVVY